MKPSFDIKQIIHAEQQRDYDHPNAELLAFATMLQISRLDCAQRRRRRMRWFAVCSVLFVVAGLQLMVLGGVNVSQTGGAVATFITEVVQSQKYMISFANLIVLLTLFVALNALKLRR